jgi:lipopolysaccharide biosynthesis regulator YciM
VQDPLYFLLLLLAAALGYLVARWRSRPRVSRRKLQRDEIVRGLNYLLRDEADDAINALSEAIQHDSETIEPHLALGNLCRRKGEVDRAIRIHENLLLRSSLTQGQRREIHFELAQDYLSAGWHDRAETMLAGINIPAFHERPLVQKMLLDLYQRQQDWSGALRLVEQMSAEVPQKTELSQLAAQFCCQLAEAMPAGLQQRRLLRRALVFDDRCVRATLLLANLYNDAGRHRKALRTLMQIFEQDIRVLSEALPLLQILHERLGRGEQLLSQLQQSYQDEPSILLVHAIGQQLRNLQGVEAEASFLGEARQRFAHPYFLYVTNGAEQDVQFQDMLRRLHRNGDLLQPAYRCTRCGFSLSQFYWHCPSCKNWDSIRAENPPLPVADSAGEEDRSADAIPDHISHNRPT